MFFTRSLQQPTKNDSTISSFVLNLRKKLQDAVPSPEEESIVVNEVELDDLTDEDRRLLAHLHASYKRHEEMKKEEVDPPTRVHIKR